MVDVIVAGWLAEFGLSIRLQTSEYRSRSTAALVPLVLYTGAIRTSKSAPSPRYRLRVSVMREPSRHDAALQFGIYRQQADEPHLESLPGIAGRLCRLIYIASLLAKMP
jgi:hypothetical protein